ncbi:hypothetical protein B0T16DRAFT_491403 [Cercophora newfieldiana]|uniref:Uncharacterized protein n=1 Tax=Cercophora newfieldiana TaxID=92897 RepID=A0AA39Y9W8_9PEZI|nr:hypothetical protein B0T16DRAFT_491403 [Cercophora newfieldiana]
MARQFRFVAVSNPTESPSSESKRLAFSHAFRRAHAQRRRRQVGEYQREKVAGSLSVAAPANKISTASEEAVPSPSRQAINNIHSDPFSSMSRPFSRVEYFLLDHYVRVIVPFTIGHCGLFDSHPEDHKTQLLREWVGLPITDDTLMVAAVLLSTCRYILKTQPYNLSVAQLALQYKQLCLQALREEMNNLLAPVSVMTVAKALALALDEVTTGERAIAQRHLKGVFAMVDSSGGAEELGLTGLLERMYGKFMEVLGL